MTDTKNYFKENLNRLIREKGATQKEIADFIGVSTPTMNYYVKGVNIPRMDKLEKLCTFFGCTKSDLLEPVKQHDITDNFPAYCLLLKDLGYKIIRDTDTNGYYVSYTDEHNDGRAVPFKDKEELCIYIKRAMDKFNKITTEILAMTLQVTLDNRWLELEAIKIEESETIDK